MTRVILAVIFLISISIRIYGYEHTYNYIPSKYRVEDFYGTWVAVKSKIYYCYFLSENDEEMKDLIGGLGKRVKIESHMFKDEINNISPTSFKYVTLYYDSSKSKDREYDGNSYNIIGVYSSNLEEVYESFGKYGNMYVVNKDKLVIESRDIAYTLIREKEANKLERYAVEVPYNYIGTNCNYIGRNPLRQYEPPRTDKEREEVRLNTKDKELDEYAKSLEGKYNVIRGYIGYSAVDGEE